MTKFSQWFAGVHNIFCHNRLPKISEHTHTHTHTHSHKQKNQRNFYLLATSSFLTSRRASRSLWANKILN